MKRDLDMCRQLLADIEAHGPDCAVTALRPGVSGEAEETLRYHVRLLIDAGLAKEVERPSAGVPCVRLTSSGHELLELARSEALWREAKWIVGERTGTQSLTVIRAVLARWAYEAAITGARRPIERGYAPERGYRPYAYRPAYHRVEPRYRFERDVEPVVEPRVAAARPFRSPYAYVERFDWRAPIDWRDASGRETFYREPLYREGLYREPAYRDGFLRDGEFAELDGVTLPTYVV
jgi:hypothetical protein